MDRLIIENVRCFRGRHEVPLAPLTILVGENSTGKSTLLAMARLAWDVSFENTVNFNEEPFRLGSYDQIASFLSPHKGVAEQFSIGFGTQSLQSGQDVLFIGEFTRRKDQPSLISWRAKFDSTLLEIEYGEEEVRSLKAEGPFPPVRLGANDIVPFGSLSAVGSSLSPNALVMLSGPRLEVPSEFLRRYLISIGSETRPVAFAPIRTSPQRTYDPVKEIVNPEGGHVPMVLANLSSKSQKDWKALKKALEGFGRASGLFAAVNVRRLGQDSSNPFQLQIKIAGSRINLVDVGYGVSQALPILVDCLRERGGRTFLLQQPEVHLHPKAQAELASFFAFLAKQQNKRFLIETHSDYLVDRIRMDIRDRKNGLQPEDVSLLYFEREDGTVKIHRLMLDKLGNIENAPPGYRKFILEEERRFLGI